MIQQLTQMMVHVSHLSLDVWIRKHVTMIQVLTLETGVHMQKSIMIVMVIV